MTPRDKFNQFALRIQDSLSGMRPRDRKLMILLGGVFLILSIGGCIWGMRSHVRGLDSRIELREDAVQRAQLMALEYTNSLATAKEIQGKLAEHQSTNLSTFLEKAATSIGIRDRLVRVQEKTSTMEGEIQETLFSAELTQITLEDASNFLYEIETAGYPLKIRSAKLKSRKYKGEKMIRLTLEIAAYKATAIAEGGEG